MCSPGGGPSRPRTRSWCSSTAPRSSRSPPGCASRAWRRGRPRRPSGCGRSRSARPAAEQIVAKRGITASVELLPWLSDAEFESNFAGAALILFPSDVEGFGLPAIEAMLLGIPVVVSDDPALVEVTGGHAVV